MTITKANIMDHISDLEEMGFKRWQKNGMDRMYIDARKLGYDRDTRTFKGERISGGLASKFETSKTYIDLKEMLVVSTCCDLAYEVAHMLELDDICAGRCKYEIA